MPTCSVHAKWFKKGIVGFKKQGWEITYDNNTDFYEFPKGLIETPLSLRSSNFWKEFDSLVKTDQGRLADFLNSLVLAEKDGVSLKLQFDAGYWNQPWEAVLQLLYSNMSNSRLLREKLWSCLSLFRLIRTTEQSLPYKPVSFDEPLSILIVLGDDGKDEGNYVALEETAETIRAAWRSLTASAKSCINEPVVEKGTAANLEGLIKKHGPHILWYNGHGRGGKNPGIKLADKQWLAPAALSNIISRAQHKVLFCIFWACDTAEGISNESFQLSFPAFYRELLQNEVLAFVGMQSPIRVSKAGILARETFSYLAKGLSFPNAVSKARFHLLKSTFKKDLSFEPAYFDWASPVIWTGNEDPDEYQWNMGQQHIVAKQWSMVEIIRILANELGIEDIQKSSIPVVAPISLFNHGKNTWISGAISDYQFVLGFGLGLLRQMNEENKQLLVINLRTTDASRPGMNGEFSMEVYLKDWAKDILNRATPGNLDAALQKHLQTISEHPQFGFSHLLEHDDIRVILFGVNESPDENGKNRWFWDALQTQQGHVAILSNLEKPRLDFSCWQVDQLQTVENMEADIETALHDEPLLCHVLATLDIPIRPYYLSNAGICRGEVSEWTYLDRICLSTASGILIYSSVKNYILHKLSDEEKRQAHEHCFTILAETTTDLETLFYHSQKADLSQQLNLADDLIIKYRDQGRYLPVLQIRKALGSLENSLTEDAKLTIAWAYVVIGDEKKAKYRLERIRTNNPINTGFKHGLLAEVGKSSGKPEHALEEVQKGIEVLEAYLQTGNNEEREKVIQHLLALRNDKARILHYLFYRYEEAIQEYRQQLAQLQRNFPGDIVAIATVKRNLSECLRSQYRNTNEAVLLQEADRSLQDATDLARDNNNPLVYTEVLYEKAKVEQHRETPVSGLYKKLLEEVIDTAPGGHLMLYAIARNRYFWDFELPTLLANEIPKIFEPKSKIRLIQDDLLYFKYHGWAKRTLITSRIRTAKCLYDYSCLEELQAVKTLILSTPVLDVGISDKRNIAECWAGLSVCTMAIPDWTEFKQQFSWAADWIAEKNDRSDPGVVWNNIKLNNF